MFGKTPLKIAEEDENYTMIKLLKKVHLGEYEPNLERYRYFEMFDKFPDNEHLQLE
jgi:hypothetical protein